MVEPISEIPTSQYHETLASDLKDRVPLEYRENITEGDLKETWRFINNPFSDLSFLRGGHPLAWEYGAQIKRLQGTPLFRELQEAAKKHLTLGYESPICLHQAFYLTLYESSLPRLIELRKKYDERGEFTADEDVKEMFNDLERYILTDKKAKEVFFYNLVNNVPDTSPDWEERREVAEFVRKQASNRKRFLVGDFGCGIGEWTRKFKEQLGDAATVFASDQQYHEVPYYQWAPDKGLVFFRANFMNIPLPDESLDCALLSYVIPYITKDAAARGLREIERVLKDGGCLIIGPIDKKDSWESGWAVLRKKAGLLTESEKEFI